MSGIAAATVAEQHDLETLSDGRTAFDLNATLFWSQRKIITMRD
jgi:hypothetical protein